MNHTRRLIVAGLALVVFAVPGAALGAGLGHGSNTTTLPQQVRDATRKYKDVNAAMADGYVSLGMCVSSPEEGAMGVHFAKSDLIGDDQVVPDQPELLIYEPHNGQYKLVGVEFLVLAANWDAAHTNPADPPMLTGQLLQFVGAPNRYRLPAFYELHVWAWKNNPKGTFADFNPTVSCVDYTG